MLETRLGRPILIAICSAIVLIAAMAGGGAIAMSTVHPYLRARDWVEIEAEVSSLVLIKEDRRIGNRVTRIVSCEALYTFNVDGVMYTGNRASLIKEDPFGNFQERIYNRLLKLREEGNVTCFYNVRNPRDSALIVAIAPESLSVALVAFTFGGGAGLAWFLRSLVRIRTGIALNGDNKLNAIERNWPIVPIALALYFAVLGTCTVLMAVDSLIHGWPMGGINLCFGAAHIIFVVLSIFRLRKARNPGCLLVPEGHSDNDMCTVQVPNSWVGAPNLNMRWVKETGLLAIKNMGKPKAIIDPSCRNRGNVLEIDFVPVPLAGHLNGSEMVGIRLDGVIGDQAYTGTFMVGKAYDYQVVATRRDLGALFTTKV